MKRLALLIALLLSFSTALAQSKRTGTFRFHARTSGHSVSVVFRVKPFTSGKPVYNPNIGVMVNGRKAHGAESTPESEVASMTVTFDRRKIRIPRHLYSDCLDPNLRDNPVTIRFVRNFTAVRITIGGSDGAGGYDVTWVVPKNGRTTRSFYEP